MIVDGMQLAKIVDHDDIEAVFSEAETLFGLNYPDADFRRVRGVFTLVKELFAGRFAGYRGCNTEYHNIIHTTDVFLASLHLLDGFLTLNALGATTAERLAIAALLHDTGYIQESDDLLGTGARHTKNHVARSKDFVSANAAAFGLGETDIEDINAIIECTNLASVPAQLKFPLHDSEVAGMILGTADLLGQMADRAYLEKLLFLYREFREAGFPGYDTEFDILRKTRDFYLVIRKRLDFDLGKTWEFAQSHFLKRDGVDENLYMKSIENQMEYLDRIIADDTTNFRKKLKRIDLEDAEQRLA